MPGMEQGARGSGNSSQQFAGTRNETEFQKKVVTSYTGPYGSKMVGDYKQFQEIITKMSEKYGFERRKKEIENMKETTEEEIELKRKATEDLNKQILAAEQKALLTLSIFHEKQYKRLNVAQKADYLQMQREKLEDTKKMLQEEYDYISSQMEVADEKDRELLKEQLSDKKKQLEKAEKEELEGIEKVRKARTASNFKELSQIEDIAKNWQKNNKLKSSLQIAVNIGKIDSKKLDEMYQYQKQTYQQSKQELEKARDEYEQLLHDENADQERLDNARDAYIQQMLKADAEATKQVLLDVGNRISQGIDNQFLEVEGIFANYKGIIESRLQGSDKNFDDIMDMVSSNLVLSPWVKTQEVVNNVKQLASEGIAYNIEQRAFLETIKDKIAATFDAFDSNLTRLIRLQQADSTAARLGMEASLTKLFNDMFKDSSYLSGISDAVSGAIIDANATMTRDMSMAFEFQVQKWLGSLSSLGMSESTVSQLAQGINYLATGNVSALAGNTPLQTLFAMSAANAGLDYSELLLKGLDASSINKLMKSMVEYLKTIAEGSDNQVVRAAYGNIFNMSMSDMRAIANLSSADISNISSKSLDTTMAMSELVNQLAMVTTRTTLTEKMQNLFNNATFALAENIVSSPVMYPMYKVLDYMKQQDIDFNIPYISVAGFGVDLNASVRDIMSTGLKFVSGLGLIGDIISGLGSNGGLDLSRWGGEETLSRGSGSSFTSLSSRSTTSSSTYISSGSSEDIKRSSIAGATEESEETRKITNKNMEDKKTSDDIYWEILQPTIGYQGTLFFNVYDKELFNKTDDFYNLVKEGMSNKQFKVIDVDRGRLLDSISSLYTGITALNTAKQDKLTEDNIKSAVEKAVNEAFNITVKTSAGKTNINLSDFITMIYKVITNDNAVRVTPATGAEFKVKSSSGSSGTNFSRY